jgi:hypothetical protein
MFPITSSLFITLLTGIPISHAHNQNPRLQKRQAHSSSISNPTHIRSLIPALQSGSSQTGEIQTNIPVPSSTPGAQSSNHDNTVAIVVAVVLTVLVLLLLGVIGFFVWRWRKRKQAALVNPSAVQLQIRNSRTSITKHRDAKPE